MKVTATRLRQIIKEEINNITTEIMGVESSLDKLRSDLSKYKFSKQELMDLLKKELPDDIRATIGRMLKGPSDLPLGREYQESQQLHEVTYERSMMAQDYPSEDAALVALDSYKDPKYGISVGDYKVAPVTKTVYKIVKNESSEA